MVGLALTIVPGWPTESIRRVRGANGRITCNAAGWLRIDYQSPAAGIDTTRNIVSQYQSVKTSKADLTRALRRYRRKAHRSSPGITVVPGWPAESIRRVGGADGGITCNAAGWLRIDYQSPAACVSASIGISQNQLIGTGCADVSCAASRHMEAVRACPIIGVGSNRSAERCRESGANSRIAIDAAGWLRENH